MQNSQALRRSPGIVSFDRDSFNEACAALMRIVVQDGPPDALIGIRTGGFYVAEAMAKAAGYAMPVLALTCRRPTTRHKENVVALKALASHLPRPVVDSLRIMEHAILTRKRPTVVTDTFMFDPIELAILDDWMLGAGRQPSLVVVDDAVDSGSTLSRVLNAVSRSAPPASKIRSAVITVTTPRPLALPNYTLHRQQLCRFPWSLDA